MRHLVILLLVLVAIVGSSPANDKYTTKYDHINVEEILKSERLLKNYFNCIMGTGSCTREGQLLKELVPDALQTECSKCSETQKKIAGKVMAHIQLYHPDMWEALLKKFDPDGNFRKKYGYDDNEDEDDK